MTGGTTPDDSQQPRCPEIVAFYLPQFHPIPENDRNFEPGHTEWNAVSRARPLFRGHRQPIIPGELGFYDLRVPETRERQADLAREYGVAAFCYWHYWFGDGRRTLERPFTEVLATGRPRFPFCLAWANHDWVDPRPGPGRGRLWIEQRYPGVQDYERHFHALLPAFSDPRYYRVDGRLLFHVFSPPAIPEVREFTDTWRNLAQREGLGDILFLGRSGPTFFPLDEFDEHLMVPPIPRLTVNYVVRNYRRVLGRPQRVRYDRAVVYWMGQFRAAPNVWTTVTPNWDDTPRLGRVGRVLVGSSPEAFQQHVADVVGFARSHGHPVVFLKSWNEWAEGNYVEPDSTYGRGWLEALRDGIALASSQVDRTDARRARSP